VVFERFAEFRFLVILLRLGYVLFGVFVFVGFLFGFLVFLRYLFLGSLFDFFVFVRFVFLVGLVCGVELLFGNQFFVFLDFVLAFLKSALLAVLA
jgi:hypothetical protein